MTAAKRPAAPALLAPAGRALWKRLAGEYDFDTRELTVLEMACRQADDIAALEAELRGPDGTAEVIVAGSKGQPRLSAVVTELRQCRLAMSRLLDALALPDEATGKPATEASRRAAHAAQSRWGQVRGMKERGERASG